MLVRLAADKAKEIGAEILIIDTLGHYAGFRDEDENNAARVTEAFAPLQAAAARGLAPIVVHHGNKKQGENMTSIRGSTAFHAVPDAVVDVRFFAEPDDPKRVIRVSGRLEDHAPPLVVELKRPEGGFRYYELIGDASTAQVRHAKDVLHEILLRSPEWWTRDDLEGERKAATIGRDPWNAALAEIDRKKEAQVVGGRRGNPKRDAA